MKNIVAKFADAGVVLFPEYALVLVLVTVPSQGAALFYFPILAANGTGLTRLPRICP
jgi:hypothetical protein